MALVRCENHRPEGRTHKYEKPVRPVGHPESGLVCGNLRCELPGLVWLDTDDATSYESGRRVFELPNTQAAKIRVQ